MARAKITAANYVPSLIRTYVPVIVGLVVAFLATRGLHLDAQSQAGVTALATGVITGVYYTAVRALEIKYPALGILLGHKTQPVYPPKPSAPVVGSASPPAPDLPVGPFRPA